MAIYLSNEFARTEDRRSRAASSSHHVRAVAVDVHERLKKSTMFTVGNQRPKIRQTPRETAEGLKCHVLWQSIAKKGRFCLLYARHCLKFLPCCLPTEINRRRLSRQQCSPNWRLDLICCKRRP